MKQPKKLTRNQKEILVKKGMNPDDYMLHSEDEKEMILYNRKEKRLEAVERIPRAWMRGCDLTLGSGE